MDTSVTSLEGGRKPVRSSQHQQQQQQKTKPSIMNLSLSSISVSSISQHSSTSEATKSPTLARARLGFSNFRRFLVGGGSSSSNQRKLSSTGNSNDSSSTSSEIVVSPRKKATHTSFDKSVQSRSAGVSYTQQALKCSSMQNLNSTNLNNNRDNSPAGISVKNYLILKSPRWGRSTGQIGGSSTGNSKQQKKVLSRGAAIDCSGEVLDNKKLTPKISVKTRAKSELDVNSVTTKGKKPIATSSPKLRKKAKSQTAMASVSIERQISKISNIQSPDIEARYCSGTGSQSMPSSALPTPTTTGGGMMNIPLPMLGYSPGAIRNGSLSQNSVDRIDHTDGVFNTKRSGLYNKKDKPKSLCKDSNVSKQLKSRKKDKLLLSSPQDTPVRTVSCSEYYTVLNSGENIRAVLNSPVEIIMLNEPPPPIRGGKESLISSPSFGSSSPDEVFVYNSPDSNSSRNIVDNSYNSNKVKRSPSKVVCIPSTTTSIVQILVPDNRNTPTDNPATGCLGGLVVDTNFKTTPSKSVGDSMLIGTPLTGTPDMGLSSPSFNTYNEAMSNASLQNFFSRKVIKSNLKRTKSVTKLERRKMSMPGSGVSSGGGVMVTETGAGGGYNGADVEGSPKFSLKRTMSLGRLAKKSSKSQHNASNTTAANNLGSKRHGGSTRDIRNNHRNHHDQHNELGNVINSRMRASRSHESLLTSPSSLHSIDLSGPDIQIKPLHSSMLGQDHCFQVTTSTGSKYYSCRSAEERQKWIQHLRKTVEPNQEQTRRTDHSIKLWVQEAKNIASKKRYFCELCLDRTIYARTSTKLKGDLLFWGEQFDFTNLPPVEVITINVYREPDKKRKKEKNSLVGYVNIPVTDVSSRQLVEKWYTCSSATVGKPGKDGKGDMPILRIKARYQTVNILPMDMYDELLEYIEQDYSVLVEVLEPLISVKSKEDIASSLVSIFQKRGKVKDLLSDIVMTEVNKLENENLAFRGNTIATKAVEAHMKLVGEKYLQDTLIDFVRTVLESGDDCEVDPMKVNNNSALQRHQAVLTMYCEMAWFKIINSHCFFPRELKEVFQSLRERCEETKRGDVSGTIISACIFLRFLCPAILSPSLFQLTQEFPHETGARNLTLIAKTVQNLANFTKFGAKEDYMTFLNDFVDRELPSMKNFVQHISEVSENDQVCEFDGFIDMGKELSLLHTLLEESLQKMNETSELKLGRLKEILSRLTDAVNNPEPVKTQEELDAEAMLPATQAYNNLSAGGAGEKSLTSQLSHDSNSGVSSEVNTTTTTTAATKVFVANITKNSEDNVAKANELSAFMPVVSSQTRYGGSAFDNPHRNGSLTKGSSIDYTLAAADDVNNTGVYKSTLNANISAISATGSPPSGTGVITGDDKLGPSQSTPAMGGRRPSEKEINHSWTKIVSAADMISGDYVDLISFVDESATTEDDTTHNSSVEFDVNGDQASVGQVSTVGSSGYQSFTGGHSQSNSPVDSSNSGSTVIAAQNNVLSSSQDPASTSVYGNNVYNSQYKQPISHTSTVHTVVHSQQSQQPLSFANPLFGQLPSRFVQPGGGSRDPRRRGMQRSPSSSSLSSGEDNNGSSLKSFSNSSRSGGGGHRRRVSKGAGGAPVENSEVVYANGATAVHNNMVYNSANNTYIANNAELGGSNRIRTAQPPQDLTITPRHYANTAAGVIQQDAVVQPQPRTCSPIITHGNREENDQLRSSPILTSELSKSAEFSHLRRQQAAAAAYNYDNSSTGSSPYQMRRTVTDTGISQYGAGESPPTQGVMTSQSAPQGLAMSSSQSANMLSGDSATSSAYMLVNSPRHVATTPQGSVRMGISSVQRRIHEQDLKKSEYEQELTVLRQQLEETQVMLQETQTRLLSEEVQRQQSMNQWQSKLHESEERLQKQQLEKDRKMDEICTRLMTVEDELHREQDQLQHVVKEKQDVIELQERRIEGLDAANNRLLCALGSLRDRYNHNNHPTTIAAGGGGVAALSGNGGPNSVIVNGVLNGGGDNAGVSSNGAGGNTTVILKGEGAGLRSSSC